jgi:CheY-like chemotaxis protein
MEEKKSTILIVDDTSENIKMLALILEKNGYEIAIAINGNAALKFCEHYKPDLILLDIMMPEMDGYEVCELLKKSKETKEIPVIFITAKVDKTDVVKGFEVGAVDYITKPFFSEELLARIKVHIDLKKAYDEIEVLRGIIPICMYCKKIRNSEGYWQQVEEYITQRSQAVFSHSICEDCATKYYGDLLNDK